MTSRHPETSVRRAAALIALLFGAAGSAGLFLRAAWRSPPLLVLLIGGWVLAPFMALLWANLVSNRWPVPARATLYGVMLVVAVGSLAAYLVDALGPPRGKAAFVFVAVPLGSWLLMAIAVPIAALVSRRR